MVADVAEEVIGTEQQTKRFGRRLSVVARLVLLMALPLRRDIGAAR